jgi:hypothetical protein
VIPLLAREVDAGQLCEQVTNINECLAYTIHRFSDHFQDMHQKQILEHNKGFATEIWADGVRHSV